MVEKKLESFKIGEKQPLRVDTKKNADAEPEQVQQSYSVGFGRIESILDEEDPVSVSDRLNALLQKLEDFDRQSKTQKDKAAAKKAMVAAERTADLLDFLFHTKENMQTQETIQT